MSAELITMEPSAIANLSEEQRAVMFQLLQADQITRLTAKMQSLATEIATADSNRKIAEERLDRKIEEANRKAELALEVQTKKDAANANPAYLSIKQLADAWSPSITFPTLKVLLTKAGVMNGFGRPYAEHTGGENPLAYEKASYINGHTRAFWAYHEDRLRKIVFSYLKRVGKYDQYLTCTDRKTLTDFIDHL